MLAWLKNNLPGIVFTLAILAFVANILYVWNSSAVHNSIMGNDEYFFYRTTMNLPRYDTDGMWLCEEVAPNPMAVDDYTRGLFDLAYTKPIWVHPLVANYIAYPIAMLFDDVASQIQWLRLIDVAIIAMTAFLFLDIIRRKTNPYVAAVSILPMMVGRWLLANGIMFYNDLFMWLFFALTVWVATLNPRSKWVILLALVTVMCKLNAILLLAPILLYLYFQARDKTVVAKVGITSVTVFIGFMVFQAVVAGDALYVIHHWGVLSAYAQGNLMGNVFSSIWSYILSWGLWATIPLLVAGIAVIVKKKIKPFYGFASFGVVTLLFSFGWGFYAYQVYPIMYASMFMIPAIWFSSRIREGIVADG